MSDSTVTSSDAKASGESNMQQQDNNGERVEEGESESLVLHITNAEDQRSYSLNFKPAQTVLSIKLDITHLTDIPVSR